MTLLLILTFVLGFTIVAASIPPILRVAKAKNLFDNNNDRKNHKGFIPPLGGVAIFLGFVISSIIFTDGYNSVTLKYLIASSILMFFTGLKDDLVNISTKKKIIVELKAVKELTDIHFAQLRSYLKAAGLRVGLLLNFAKPTLEIRRVVN